MWERWCELGEPRLMSRSGSQTVDQGLMCRLSDCLNYCNSDSGDDGI